MISAPRDQVAFGPFRFDPRRRLLSRDGAAIALGERALDVLSALVEADGELVPKAELMAKAWPGLSVEENNLQVQIYALRRALGEDGNSHGYVRTVSGRGYRFVGDAPATARPDTVPPAPAQEVRYCRTADGVHLAVASLGDGPPLVRAPVWMSHVDYDWRTSIWASFLLALSCEHRLVRYDGRGLGLSDRDVEMSFEAAVGDLETVVDALGLERFSLLGMSQGAPVSVAYAARHPDRVERLVLAGGYASGTRIAYPERSEAVEALATLVRAHWGSGNPAFRQLFTSLGFPAATAEQMQELNELQRQSATAEAAARVVRMTADFDVSHLLERVRAPTLVLHSREDAWIPAERGRQLARGIAGARFVEFAGPNHVILPQDPAFQRYVSEILEFLRPA